MSASRRKFIAAHEQLRVLLLTIAALQVTSTQRAISVSAAASGHKSIEHHDERAPRLSLRQFRSTQRSGIQRDLNVRAIPDLRQDERLDGTATDKISSIGAAGQTNSSQQQQAIRSYSSELSRWLSTRDLWGGAGTSEPAVGNQTNRTNQTASSLPMVVQVTAIHVDKSEFPLSKLLFKLTLRLALIEANKYLELQQQQQQQQLESKQPYQKQQQQLQRRRIKLSLSVRSANTCSRQYAAALAAEEYYVRKSRMFIVSGCDDAIRDVSRLASQWQVPIMTAAGFGVDLDDKVLHSTLIRVAFSMRAAVEFLFKIMKSFQWRRVNLVVDESDTNSFAMKGSIEQHALKYKSKDSRIELNTISIDLKKLMRHGDLDDEQKQQQQQWQQQSMGDNGSFGAAGAGTEQIGAEPLLLNVTTRVGEGAAWEGPAQVPADSQADGGDDDHWPNEITNKVIRDTLWQCSMNSRVTILLIPQHLVRRFMLSVYDQHMANGLYTFVNMPLLMVANEDQTDAGQAGLASSVGPAGAKQQAKRRQRKDSYTFSTGENVFLWRSLRSRSRNAHAKQAFESLMSIYLRTPTTKAYIYFASKLNTLANSQSRAAILTTTTTSTSTTEAPSLANSSASIGAADSTRAASGGGRPRVTAPPSSPAAGSHEQASTGKKIQLNINPYSASFYDSLQIYAAALLESMNLLTKEYQQTVKATTNSTGSTAASRPVVKAGVKRRWFDGAKLHAKIADLVKLRRFDNMITGNIYINQNGDRETDYTLDDMNQMTGKFAPVIMYRGETRDIERLGRIHWSSDASVGPTTDTVDCTLTGTCVSKPMTRFTFVLILLAGPLVFILSGVFYFVHNKLSLESQLVDHWWRIHLNEIELPPGKLSGNHPFASGANSSRRSGGGSTTGVGSGGGGGVRTEITKATGTSAGWASSAQDSCYGNISLGIYKLSKVALKPIGKFHQSRKLTIELRSIKEINHSNLCRFIGILVDEGSLAIVSEFCPKGSLREFFHNESMVIDWTFKYSIINDIMAGLLYLHSSPLAFHGRLKSSNCLVSARFVVKLSDYGPHSLYEQLDDDVDLGGAYGDEHDDCKDGGYERLASWLQSRIWLAPEHMKASSSRVGSMKGDVYSLGLLLYEIITNCSPFFSAEKDDFVMPLRALYNELKRNGASDLMEPKVKAIETELDETDIGPLVELMQTCWRFEPGKRPTSLVVSGALKKITRGVTSKKLLENLTLRMEQYTNNLESLVDAKLAALMEEKFKAEELLYQFVPKSIASLLKEGQFVEPEAFECVTVFYSDIVGFTSLSSDSSPMEVIDFLSDLYLCFDSTLEQHDIFKVDTIGDAYIVASGLPQRNEDKHVVEIACAALELRERVRCFKIPHKPDHNLEMRVGIHSGPCIAGIVGGLNMPKYCVFGDTLTIGNFMESSGLPMKIHITEESRKLLRGVGGFSIEPRTPKITRDGLPFQTYWLENNAAD